MELEPFSPQRGFHFRFIMPIRDFSCEGAGKIQLCLGVLKRNKATKKETNPVKIKGNMPPL